MLTGVDKQSGLTLPDDNIVAQCLTFLVAGHETTSGLLSFAIYFLLKNPECAQAGAGRGRRGARRIRRQPTYEQIHRLTYVRQVLDETLRLWPTAPMFTRTPLQDTVVGGKYAFPKDTGLSILVPLLHRDRSVWGDDAEVFDPDRFPPERFTAVPPERVPAVRHRHAGLHRPPVRPAGGDSRSRTAAAAVRFHRPPQLPTADRLHVDRQARRLLDQDPPADRPPAAGGHPGTRARLHCRRPSRSAGVRSPTATAPRCWCCSDRTWAPRRESPTGSAARARSGDSR